MTGNSAASDPIELLRGGLAADRVWRDRLAAIDDLDAFVIAAKDAAAAMRIPIDGDTIHAALRFDPIGLDRFDDFPIDTIGFPEVGWLPISVEPARGGLAVDWAHFGDRGLTAPFFEQSIYVARRRPINRLLRYRTALAALAAQLPDDRSIAPDGFIFHMSRCGSTLVAQMLAATAEHIVISEAPPLDAAVRQAQAGCGMSMDERVRLLRAMVAALGRTGEKAARYFVKLDSWHTLALPLFRRAFPETPWVFLYRDPVEVMVSQRRVQGLQMLPGMLDDVLDLGDHPPMESDSYTARVLARVVGAVSEHHGLGGGLLVNYRDLPGAVESAILPHFGVAPDAEMRAAMADTATRDVKKPGLPFIPDTAHKQREAMDSLRTAAADHVGAVYHRLERLRETGMGA